MNLKKTIWIKIKGDYAGDIRKIIENPKKAEAQPENVIYVDSLQELSSIFTPKRMEILEKIKEHKGITIGRLANKTDRKQEAVSRDVHILLDFGILKLKRKNRSVVPELNTKSIRIALTA